MDGWMGLDSEIGTRESWGAGGAQAAAREGSEAAAEVLLAFGAKIMVCSD